MWVFWFYLYIVCLFKVNVLTTECTRQVGNLLM